MAAIFEWGGIDQKRVPLLICRLLRIEKIILKVNLHDCILKLPLKASSALMHSFSAACLASSALQAASWLFSAEISDCFWSWLLSSFFCSSWSCSLREKFVASIFFSFSEISTQSTFRNGGLKYSPRYVKLFALCQFKIYFSFPLSNTKIYDCILKVTFEGLHLRFYALFLCSIFSKFRLVSSQLMIQLTNLLRKARPSDLWFFL